MYAERPENQTVTIEPDVREIIVPAGKARLILVTVLSRTGKRIQHHLKVTEQGKTCLV